MKTFSSLENKVTTAKMIALSAIITTDCSIVRAAACPNRNLSSPALLAVGQRPT